MTLRANDRLDFVQFGLHRDPDASIGAQLLGIVTIFAWVFATSFVVWLIVKSVIGIRVSEQEEYEGVDIGECGLEAYPEFAHKTD